MTGKLYDAKPFQIEAIHYHGSNFDEVVAFTNGYFCESEAPGPVVAKVYDYLHKTWVGVRPLDYIIKGSKGEFYPCDPAIFEAKYEEHV